MKVETDRGFLPVLLLLILGVYLRVSWHGFLNYDDPLYVTANPVVQAGLTFEGIRWAFASFHAYNWHPLTWLSHMLDVQLFGVTPVGHHMVNLALHLGNTALLFHVLRRMTGAVPESLFVAALFALHPLHVESVAWVAERKDVLSGFFWMLTLLAYIRYADSPALKRYGIVAASFTLGLMAKPMLVTLPFILLLLDWWPLDRLARTSVGPLLLEKIPLIALSAGSCVVTFLAQREGGALASMADGSVGSRVAEISLAYAAYLGKTSWPGGLAVYYPFRTGPIAYPAAAVGAFFLLLVSLLAVRWARIFPFLPVGWFWFLGTLVPVIGVVRFGTNAIADRYTYLPLIGLFIVFAWSAGEIVDRIRLERKYLLLPAVAVIGTLSVASFFQLGYWRDDVTLYSRAVEVTKGNWLAHKNLAAALANRGDLTGALVHVSESVTLRPDASGYVGLAWIYSRLGDFERSIDACREALRMDPVQPQANYLLGHGYVMLGKREDALRQYDVLEKIDRRLAGELARQLNLR